MEKTTLGDITELAALKEQMSATKAEKAPKAKKEEAKAEESEAKED